MQLYTDTLEKDYIKKIEINNINFTQINKILSIKKDEESEYKKLNFNYFEFEKNSNYSIIINFNKVGENKYKLRYFRKI